MFSVFTIADFIASSLEKPFWIALQYFLEKLLEILFCSKLTLGSEVSKAKPIAGFSWKITNKSKLKKNFNNSSQSILYKYYNRFFKLSFQSNLIIIKSKLNFNLLIITSIAISSVIIVRGLFDYKYVRIIDDIAIFSWLDKWITFRFLNSSFFCRSCDFPIQHDSC